MNAITTPNGRAPLPDERFHFGPRMAAAWQHVWDHLDAHEYRDGTLLAGGAEKATGIKAVSVVSHLHRMAKAGYLDTEIRSMPTRVERNGKAFTSTRKRTFYRINLGSTAVAE